MRNHRWTSLVGAVVAFALGACGDGSGKVAATVEGERIAEVRVEKLAGGWLNSPQMQNDSLREVLTPARVRQMALLQLIRMSYLEKVAKEYGVPLSSTPVEHVAASEIPEEELHNVGWEGRGFQDALHAAQLSRRVGEQVFPTVTVAQERMQKYFTEHPELFEASWQASAQLAFFRDAAAAQRFASSTHPGGEFVTAAKAAGADEATDVSSVRPGTGLPDVILERVKATSPGTVGPPLKVETGSWVIGVSGRTDSPPQSFDEARPAIEKHLADQQRQELFSDWLDKQLKSAKVSVAKRYGAWPFGI
jgi:hypothetical protein